MRVLALLLLTLLGRTVQAQTVIEKAVQQLDSLSAGYPQEKLFVHTDRSVYVTGETIWFSAYATVDNKPTYLSKVMYVELADATGRILEKRTIPLANGQGSGEILLKKEWKAGSYVLNAYTLWMLNFPHFLFSRQLQVYGTEAPKGIPATGSFSFRFFPEGGQVIAGVENRIAFKALSSAGQPLSLTGELLDGQGKKLADFRTVHDGMGSFLFTPTAGQQYKAVLTTAEGKKTVNLDTPLESGIAIQVNNDHPTRLFLQVNPGSKNRESINELHVLAQMNHQPVFSGKMNLGQDEYALSIPKKNLPAGILQITVFNNAGLPLAERLAFIHPQRPVISTVSIDKAGLAPRQKNELSLDLSGLKNPRVSVSVYDAEIDSTTHGDNLQTSLLLTTDLPGVVHRPGYYFADTSATRKAALDLVMLTNGWRRFKWEDLAQNRFPALKYPVESGITITGRLTKADGKSGIKHGKVDFITKAEDSTTILTTVMLNNEEKFFIPDLHFRKKATIFYQGTNQDKATALTQVKVYPSYIDTVQRASFFPAYIPGLVSTPQGLAKSLELLRIQQDKESKLLETVTVRAKKRSPIDSLNQLYASDIFLNSDQTIPMDKGNYFNIWLFLQRNVSGLRVERDQYGQYTAYFNRYNGLDAFTSAENPGDSGSSVKFFLNEIEVSRDVLETIDPSDVSLVKVWQGASSFILGASRGAIGIYTRKGAPTGDWRSRPFNNFTKDGYSVSREFFHMDYGSFKPEPDFVDERKTLFWSPKLKVNPQGKAVIPFYSSDFSRSMMIVVNGIDDEGNLIVVQKRIGN